MEKVIHSLIKEDQSGFIKGRNASDNMRRLFHILDFADSHPFPIRKAEVSIKIHDHNHSISLYADDIILYLDHFDVSVSSIIKEFYHFSSLSGYKINWNKSALMPINNVKVNSSIPSFIHIKGSFKVWIILFQ